MTASSWPVYYFIFVTELQPSKGQNMLFVYWWLHWWLLPHNLWLPSLQDAASLRPRLIAFFSNDCFGTRLQRGGPSMKFNYAAHAGPEAACVNPLHACRISSTHLNHPHHHPYRRPRARNGQTGFPPGDTDEIFVFMQKKNCRALYLNENITRTFKRWKWLYDGPPGGYLSGEIGYTDMWVACKKQYTQSKESPLGKRVRTGWLVMQWWCAGGWWWNEKQELKCQNDVTDYEMR